jgi:hemoglobin/transferrin/lactoferrin receptor protein
MIKRSSLFLSGAVLAATAVGAAGAQGVITLDTITVLATKTKQRAIDALAGVSNVSGETIERAKPARLQDVFDSTPGVLVDRRADDLGVGFNVRGLQDYGRVAVVVDGARQNFQVAQHGPEGKVYLDPELISEAQVARGPVANVYGSGAIGGVVSLTTKTVDDILDPGERFGAVVDGIAGTNAAPLLGSVFLAARPNSEVDFIGGISQRHLSDYRDGNGDVVVNSGSDTTAGLAKVTFHPGEGQELQLSEVFEHATFNSGTPGDPDVTADGGTNYGNTVNTSTLTAKYALKSPDNPLVDLAASAFWNYGSQETVVKEQYCIRFFGTDPCSSLNGMDFTGPVGTTSGYVLNTLGYDVHNASRFDAMGLDNTVTVGTDLFADTVDSTGSNSSDDAGYRMTASGNRQAYGGFGEWDAKYGGWLELTGGLRFDGYHMEGEGDEGSGTRLSPKFTVGITPVSGLTFYGTYAEGYRAPSLNEAFATGLHPGGIFEFLPNTALTPETGHTTEFGVNYTKDGLLRAGDSLRLKADVFNNDVTNYINLTDVSGSSDCDYYFYGDPYCYQYRNIAEARIRGVEFEGTYDARKWFLNATATLLDGRDTSNGEHLASVLPGQATVSVGFRFLEDKLTVAPNWQYRSGGSFYDTEGTFVSYDPYQLLGLAVAYQPNKNTVASLVVNNLLNTQYTSYLSNDPGPGISVTTSLKVKLAAE